MALVTTTNPLKEKRYFKRKDNESRPLSLSPIAIIIVVTLTKAVKTRDLIAFDDKSETNVKLKLNVKPINTRYIRPYIGLTSYNEINIFVK